MVATVCLHLAGRNVSAISGSLCNGNEILRLLMSYCLVCIMQHAEHLLA